MEEEAPGDSSSGDVGPLGRRHRRGRWSRRSAGSPLHGAPTLPPVGNRANYSAGRPMRSSDFSGASPPALYRANISMASANGIPLRDFQSAICT